MTASVPFDSCLLKWPCRLNTAHKRRLFCPAYRLPPEAFLLCQTCSSPPFRLQHGARQGPAHDATSSSKPAICGHSLCSHPFPCKLVRARLGAHITRWCPAVSSLCAFTPL